MENFIHAVSCAVHGTSCTRDLTLKYYSQLSKLGMFTIDTEFAFLITDTDQDTADTTDLFKMAAEVTKILREKYLY